jgi:peptidyl-prolyl cis-trans isomerase D
MPKRVIFFGYEGSQVPNQRKRTKRKRKLKLKVSQVNANPDSFMMLAFTNSDDSSAQQGGDLGSLVQTKW